MHIQGIVPTFSAGARQFYPLQSVKTSTEAHQASYSMSSIDVILWGKRQSMNLITHLP